MKFNNINQHILLWMLVIIILPIAMLSSFYVHYYNKNFKTQTFQQLNNIANQKTHNINHHIHEAIMNTQIIAHAASTQAALKNLVTHFQQSSSTQSIRYQTLQTDFKQQIKPILLELDINFTDILLTSNNQDILFSLNNPQYQAKNSQTLQTSHPSFSQSIQHALNLKTPYLSKFNNEFQSQMLHAFISVPIIEKGKILGVLSTQINLKKLNHIIKNTLGLGKTSAISLATVHNHRLLLTSRKKQTPLQNQNQTITFCYAMQQALFANSGHGENSDCQNNNVFSSYRYLPALNAGLVVKINTAEALKKLHNFWRNSIGFIIALLGGVMIVAYYLSLLLSRPIRQLTNITSDISQGKHQQEIEIVGSTEVQALSHAFNSMLQQLNHERQILEEQVQQRTALLSEQEQHLRLYRDQSPIASIEFDLDHQIIAWNHAAEKLFGYTIQEMQAHRFIEKLIPNIQQYDIHQVWDGLIAGQESAKINSNEVLTKTGQLILCEWHNNVLKNNTGDIIGVCSMALDITERHRTNTVLKALTETRGSNSNIFQLIVQQLAISQKVSHVILARYSPKNANIVDTIAVYGQGKLIDNFSYPLTGTPCNICTKNGRAFYPDNLQALFPHDAMLANINAVSYRGQTLKSSNDEILGILILIDSKPMLESTSSLIKLFDSLAVRATIELERKKSEEKLQFSARIFKESHEGIIITDANHIMIDVNPSFTKLSGYEPYELIGNNPSMLSSGRHSTEFYAEMRQTLNTKGYWQGETWNRSKDGNLYAQLLSISALKDNDGTVINYVGFSSNITAEKEQAQSLKFILNYDPLTGLPNRHLFNDRFAQAIANNHNTNKLLGICFFDLDKFTEINQQYGNNIGNKLLIEVSKRFQALLHEKDSIARLEGDEFIILLNDLDSFEQCTSTLDKIHDTIAQTYHIEHHTINVQASSGITLYPLDDADPETLIRHADSAMYQAKLAGRNGYQLFDTSHEQQLIKQNIKHQQVEQAFKQGELELYYQPKIKMQTGEIYGAEALIRWIHPEKGLIPPLDFLPAIENTALESELGYWIINDAFRQLNTWQQQDIFLEISVNIPAIMLQSPSFFQEVDNALAVYPDIPSHFLQLEVLESSVLDNLELIQSVLYDCRHKLGVSVALDDFGTGYSSLSHLRHLPANIIKIDQSFVRDMLEDKNDYAIVEGVIALSKAFKLKVIAEGVETEAHGVMLLELGCQYAQGYGISRPMPAKDFPAWLENFHAFPEWVNFDKS